MTKDTENIVTVNAFNTFEEADEHRKKFLHADLYGLYGLWQSDEKQLWVPIPLVALEAMINFKEPR